MHQALKVHQDLYRAIHAAIARAAFCGFRDTKSFFQLAADFRYECGATTIFAATSVIRVFFLRTTTHAPFAAEVERIVSNLVALIERFGSQNARGYPPAF